MTADDRAPVGVLVMAHGTPASPDGIADFYTEIRRGHPPPAPLLEDLRRRYRAIGGVSPLNDRTRAQVEGLRGVLDRVHPGRYVVAYGARFADPRIGRGVDALRSAGVRRAVGLVLAPQASVVSVGAYTQLARQAAAATPTRPEVALQMVDHWYDAPGFAELIADRVTAALDRLEPADRRDAAVLFTAHSVPRKVVDDGDPYPQQVTASAADAARLAHLGRWQVAWQSAGRTADPWLGPDLLEVIGTLPDTGASACVVCPVGFVSDHLEVLYDIDIEASDAARRVGLPLVRTESLNDDTRFLSVLASVVADADAAGAAASRGPSAGDRPAGGRPAGDRPAGGRPADGRPAGDRPAGDTGTGDGAGGRRATAPRPDPPARS